MDSAGNVYFADDQQHVVRKVSPSGTISLFAGTPPNSGGAPIDVAVETGSALSLRLSIPKGLAVDAADNIYIADSFKHRIIRVDQAGAAKTVAGNGTSGFSGDGGQATAAQISGPSGVAVDQAGNLFVADHSNKRVRRVSTSGVITTVAGTGSELHSGDAGPATAAGLGFPKGVAVDSANNIFVSVYHNTRAFGGVDNSRLRKIDPNGIITTLAGNGADAYAGDGSTAANASLLFPDGVVADGAGNVFVSSGWGVRKISPAAIITTIAGAGTSWDAWRAIDPKRATFADLGAPTGVAVDAAGNVYVAERYKHRVSKVDSSGALTRFAGTGQLGSTGDNGPARSAALNEPDGIAVDALGNVYVADLGNSSVRQIDAAGVIRRVAGTGVRGDSGDGGSATSAMLMDPYDVSVDRAGNLYITDAGAGRVRRVDPNGIITTVAGNGTSAYAGDGGPAESASLRGPEATEIGPDGSLYIADTGNAVIRRVSPTGTMSTYAGTGSAGFAGDGGLAVDAQLATPRDVALDWAGNLYIADNLRIRRIAPSGVIATVAGTGIRGMTGDGRPAIDAKMDPHAVATDSTGNLFIGDFGRTADGWGATPRVRVAAVGPWVLAAPETMLGARPSSGFAGDPVNTATGNFVTEDAVDLGFPSAVFGLDWSRSYNALDKTTTSLGKGWRGAFDKRVDESVAGDVTVTAGDGRRVIFAASSGTYARSSEWSADLVKRADGSFTLDYDDGHIEDFAANGRLAQSRNWDGQQVDFTYTPTGNLGGVTSSTGYSLAFAYTNGRLTAVTASDGRSTSYGYTGGALSTFTAVDGGTMTFEYDSEHRITAITDPDGVPVIDNGYDRSGRVVTQTTPSGGTILFDYNLITGVTTVTDSSSASVTRYAHDRQGRVTSITDTHGEVMSKTYDTQGNLTSMTDRRGGSVTSTYDSHGNVLTRAEPEGVNVAFVYDTDNRLVAATDGEGRTTTYAYTGVNRIPSTVTDPANNVTQNTITTGLLTSTTDADGVVTAFGYDVRRNQTSAGDPARPMVFGFDGAGNVTSVLTAMGHSTTATYDAAGRVKTVTDGAGGHTALNYTPAGRPISHTQSTGNPSPDDTATTTIAYDNVGRLATVTDPIGRQTTYGYDDAGNVVLIRRPGDALRASADTTAAYDALGRLVSTTDPTGVVLRYAYDADGNRTSTENASGKTVTTTFDLRGRLTSRSDEVNRTTTYTYDKNDRPTGEVRPDGATESYTYDAIGRLHGVVDPRGGLTTRSYTAAGRLAAITDPNNHTTTYTYDPSGRLDRMTDPLGKATTYTWDAADRIQSITTADGLVTSITHDGADRLASTTSPAGGTTTRAYTPRGHLASITEPATAPRTFRYDAAGQLTAATDPLGQTTSYAYDGRGNLTRRTDTAGHADTWHYDLANRPTISTDRLNRPTTRTYDTLGRAHQVIDPSGRSVTFDYTDANEIKTTTFADNSTVAFTYDPAGRRSTMTDGTGTTTYTWDAAGNQTSQTARGKTLQWAYDAAGNRTTMTYPDGTTATNTFDDANRLVAVNHPQSGAVSYTRSNDGRLLTETLPGVTRTYAYDDGLLANYTETRAGGPTTATALGRDLAGRVTSETTGTSTATFGYDTAGQLTQVARAGQATTYTYDALGNRSAKIGSTARTDYSYDPAQQLVSATRTTGGIITDQVAFTHDAGGRLTTALSPTRTLQVTYDPQGRSANARLLDAAGAALWNTDRNRDGDGTLVQTATTRPLTNSVTTDLVWDQNRQDEQLATVTTPAETVNHLYGESRIAALRAGGSDVYAHDAYGSTIATGAAGDLARSAGYDEYGAPVRTAALHPLIDDVLALTGDAAKDTSPTFGYRSELGIDGLVQLRAREYAPGIGRFTTIDPLPGVPGETTVANPYHYANNDPLNQIDPLGLRPVNDSDLRGGWSQSTAYANWQSTGDPYCSTSSCVADKMLSAQLRRDLAKLDEEAWLDFQRQLTGNYDGTLGDTFRLMKEDGSLRMIGEAFGFVPVVGDAVDAGFCGFDTAKGNYGSAAFSCMAIIPIVGSFGKLPGWMDHANDAARLIDSGQSARFVDIAGTIVDRHAIRSTISVQRQGRHVLGDPLYNGGGYFRDAGSAQQVLGAFHDGSAQILGVTRNGHVVVRVSSVTGFNHNPGAGHLNQQTNVFFIKGSASPSVVPANPGWRR